MLSFNGSVETVHFVNWYLTSDDPEIENYRAMAGKHPDAELPGLLKLLAVLEMQLLFDNEEHPYFDCGEIDDDEYGDYESRPTLFGPLLSLALERIDFKKAAELVLGNYVLPCLKPAAVN